MNKSELIKALAEETNIPFDDASLVVNTFIDAMKASLIAGDRIEIRGFGVSRSKIQRLCRAKSQNRRKRFRGSQTPAFFPRRQGTQGIHQSIEEVRFERRWRAKRRGFS